MLHLLEERIDLEVVYPPPFFEFVRMVKGYWPEGKAAEEAFDAIEPIVRKFGAWPPTTGGDTPEGEEAFAQFTTTWRKVRYRPDETPLDNAAAKAKAYPLGTLRSQKRPVPKYDRFVSLAGWLQVTMGDRPIMLPCHGVDEILKTTPNMVSVWRQWAIEDGFLKVTKPHSFHPHGRSEATEFRFAVNRWACLAKVAQRGTQTAFDLTDFVPNEMPNAPGHGEA